ncbi:MAG: hypothetical protein WAV05_03590 [Anaerolineales bacterium]
MTNYLVFPAAISEKVIEKWAYAGATPPAYAHFSRVFPSPVAAKPMGEGLGVGA